MSAMHILKTGLYAVLCTALLAAPAHAEKADRDKPVNLEADTVTLDDIRKVSVYQGNVIRIAERLARLYIGYSQLLDIL